MYGASAYGAEILGTAAPLYSPPPAQVVSLKINGVEKSGIVSVNSISFDDELNRRATLTFDLVDTDNSFHPPVGASVVFKYGARVIFLGTIEKPVEKLPLGIGAAPHSALMVRVQAVDSSALADRRVAIENFETPGQTAGDIAALLVAEYLAEEGVTIGQIDPGVTVEKALFPYVSLTTAFDDIAQTSGMVWWIDNNKSFFMIDRGSFNAPFSISDVFRPYRKLSVNRDRGQLRNRQYLQAGQQTSDVQDEQFLGDGNTRTYTVGLAIAEAPTVTVNGFAKTVGIQQVDTGKDFYWSKGEKQITQDEGAAPLLAVDTLRVLYSGLYPIIVTSTNVSSVNERKAIEGGSGLYEEVEVNQDIDDLLIATDLVSALLRRFGKIPTNVNFETDLIGLIPGMLLPIALTEENLNDDFLVTSVKAKTIDSAGILRWIVEAVSGEYLGGWVDFFRKLEKRGKKFTIRADEVVNFGRDAFETLILGDSISVITALDDGTNDPYTGLETSDTIGPDEFAHYIGKINIGKERFEAP